MTDVLLIYGAPDQALAQTLLERLDDDPLDITQQIVPLGMFARIESKLKHAQTLIFILSQSTKHDVSPLIGKAHSLKRTMLIVNVDGVPLPRYLFEQVSFTTEQFGTIQLVYVFERHELDALKNWFKAQNSTLTGGIPPQEQTQTSAPVVPPADAFMPPPPAPPSPMPAPKPVAPPAPAPSSRMSRGIFDNLVDDLLEGVLGDMSDTASLGSIMSGFMPTPSRKSTLPQPLAFMEEFDAPTSEIAPAPSETPPERKPTFTLYQTRNREGDQPTPYPNDRALQVGMWYRLDVALKGSVAPVDIQPQSASDSVSIPSDVPNNATLIVTLSEQTELGVFELVERTQQLQLQPLGNGLYNVAQFRFSPKLEALSLASYSGGMLGLVVRLYYKSNLLQRLVLNVKVAPPNFPLPVDVNAQRFVLEEVRGLTHVESLQPVQIHIDIDKGESATDRYMLTMKAGEDVTLFGSGSFDRADFEDWINQAREVLFNISTDYPRLQQALDAHKQVIASKLYYDHLMQLAKIGRKLWVSIFNTDQHTDLQAISAWWKDNRPSDGSTVQVDVRGAADFVFPWALLFDAPSLPANGHEIRLEDFWGLRYQIEHFTLNKAVGLPPVYPTDRALQMAMLVGAEQVGVRHHAQISQLEGRTNGKLDVTEALVKPSQARAVLDMDGNPAHSTYPLVYFLGHAYTRKDSTLQVRDGLEMFCKWYQEQTDPTLLQDYQAMADVFCNQRFTPTESFFQLNGGRVEPDIQLDADNVNLHHTQPLIFFNACQSAQNLPSPSRGLVNLLLGSGASGYIGTEIFIDAHFAEAFGLAFWEAFLSGQTVGQAFLNVRRQFAQHKVLACLAYTHYGTAQTRLAQGILPANEGQSA